MRRVISNHCRSAQQRNTISADIRIQRIVINEFFQGFCQPARNRRMYRATVFHASHTPFTENIFPTEQAHDVHASIDDEIHSIGNSKNRADTRIESVSITRIEPSCSHRYNQQWQGTHVKAALIVDIILIKKDLAEKIFQAICKVMHVGRHALSMYATVRIACILLPSHIHTFHRGTHSVIM